MEIQSAEIEECLYCAYYSSQLFLFRTVVRLLADLLTLSQPGEVDYAHHPPTLCVQMDFMQIFQTNTKCNNINHV